MNAKQVLPHVVLLLALAAMAIGCGPVGDCIWGATAEAWIDDDGNGTRDAGEAPLPNVKFYVDDTRNGYQNVASPAVSGTDGRAKLTVWLPGCPDIAFAIRAQAPPGFVATTSRTIAVDNAGKTAGLRGRGETYRFGFRYAHNIAPLTPAPMAHVACRLP